MTSDATGIQPFDPESGGVPPDLAELSETVEGGVVVLAVTDDADSGWAARSGVELARAWSRDVSRLFLMDLGLGGPSLHEALELPNEEGASDIFLYGSSVQRVARPADGGSFFFASAGTPTADPEAVLTHERWPGLLKGFRDASATVVLYLPLETPGGSSVLERADRVLVLDTTGGTGAEAVPAGTAVEVVVTAPPAAPAEVEEEAADLEDEAAKVEEGTADFADENGEVEEESAEHPIELEEAEDEPAGVVDIGELAPEEEPGDVVDIGDLAPEEEPAEVMDVGDLAPDEEAEGEVEEAMEEAASAADVEAEPEAEPEAEEPGPTIGETEPAFEEAEALDEEPAQAEDDAEPTPEAEEEPTEVVDVGDLAPDEEPGAEVEDAMAEAASAAELEEEPRAESVTEGAEDESLADGPEPAFEEPGEPDEPVGSGGSELAGVEAGLEDEADEADDTAGADDGLDLEEPAGVDEPGKEPDDSLDFGEPLDAGAEVEEEEAEGEELDLGAPAETAGDAGAEGGDEPDDFSDFGAAEEAGDEEEMADFDLGSFDALGAGDEAAGEGGGEEGEIQLRSDFGEEEDDDAGEELSPGDEEGPEPTGTEEEGPAAGEGFGGEDEPGFGGVGDEDEVGAAAGEEDMEGEEGDFDFGGFSGEMEVEEEEGVEEEEPGGLEPAADEGPSAPVPEEEPEGGFGDDLVTGPDFGHGSPDDEWDDSAGATGEAEDEVPHPSEADVADGLEAETGGPPGAADEAEPGEAEEEAEGEEAEREARERPSPGRSRPIVGRMVRLLAAALLFAGAALAAHWFGLVQIPGADGLIARVMGPAATGSAPEVVTTDPRPETPVLAYSLALDALREQGAATEVADAWQESYDDYLFMVAPVLVDGELFFRLLAGPARSSGDAEELRSALSEVLTREDPSSWVVRPTPLAFLMSEHDSPGAATGRVEELAGDDIPAYVLRVEYPGDTIRYRVYVGAYENGEEARAMEGLLSTAGYDDARFTERRGSLPE